MAGSRLTNSRQLDGDCQAARSVIRTCIGCRQRAPVTDLLRVVAVSDAPPACADPPVTDGQALMVVLPDPRRRAQGRGAWLHPELACAELAERRRAYGRALRVSARLDPAAVLHYLDSLAG